MLASYYLEYNSKKQVTYLQYDDQRYLDLSYSENYFYDSLGNIVKVYYNDIYSFYTKYTISKYDDKPNFISGNFLIKFLLLQTPISYEHFMLFSKNNASDWTQYDEYGEPEDFTSKFTYDEQGFAIKIKTYSSFNYTSVRKSSSTCDK